MTRFRMIAEIGDHLEDFFDGDLVKIKMWFTTPNPMLGGISPDDMVKAGRLEKLHAFVKEAHEENKKNDNDT